MGSDGGGDRMDLDNKGGDPQEWEEWGKGVVEWEELGGHPHILQQGDVGEDVATKSSEDAIPMFMKANHVTKTHNRI